MAELNREVLDETPQENDEVVQFGDGTESVWRLGVVKQIKEDQAVVQFGVQSDGLTWEGHSPIMIPLAKIKKIA